MLLALLAVLASPLARAETPPDGLVSYWSFDVDGADDREPQRRIEGVDEDGALRAVDETGVGGPDPARPGIDDLRPLVALDPAVPAAGPGGPRSRQSAVEADPAVFHKVVAMAKLLRNEMLNRGLLPGTSTDPTTSRGLLDYFIATFEPVEEIAEDELAARTVSTADLDFLDNIGHRFGFIAEMAGDFGTGDFELDRYSAVVADIFLGGGDSVLEVATGRFDRIYVIVPDNHGGFEVATGAVYSYYEFWQPRTNRLTDEAWWDMLDAGTEPPRPSWARASLGV